jgi:hypothetical protein
MKFLSSIAKELAPLASYHLGMTPLGTFHRQKNEDALFMMPMDQLAGKVVILSNADTSVFRSGQGQTPEYKPAEDLDYWVNARVYLDSDEYSAGVARTPDTGTKPSAVVVNLSDILALNQTKADAFAMKGKSRFVIAMTDPMKNPTEDDLVKALDALAINMVPLDIFNFDGEAVKGLLGSYKYMSYRPKADIFRKEAAGVTTEAAEAPAAAVATASAVPRGDATTRSLARAAIAAQQTAEIQAPPMPPTGNIFL